MGFARQEYWSGLPLPSPKLPLVGVNVFTPAKDGDTITSVINKPETLCLKPTIYYCTSRLCGLTAQLGGCFLIPLIQLQSDLGWFCSHWKLGWAERPKWVLFFFFKNIVFLKIYLLLVKRSLLANVGFCHTSTWISHRYTYVLSLLKLPPASHPIPSL